MRVAGIIPERECRHGSANGSRPSQAGSVRQRTVVTHIGSSRSVLNSLVQRDHEATEEEEDEYYDEDDDESIDEEHSEREVLKARPDPWCDKVVLLRLLATFCIYAGFGGFVLLLPVMLQNSIFWIAGINARGDRRKGGQAGWPSDCSPSSYEHENVDPRLPATVHALR